MDNVVDDGAAGGDRVAVDRIMGESTAEGDAANFGAFVAESDGGAKVAVGTAVGNGNMDGVGLDC